MIRTKGREGKGRKGLSSDAIEKGEGHIKKKGSKRKGEMGGIGRDKAS